MLHPEFLVYIAAPFTPTAAQKARMSTINPLVYGTDHAVRENKEAAAALGLEVASIGAMPIVPHTAHGSRPELESVQDYAFWISATAALLRRCDAALFSANWQESNGARGEHAKCEEWGIPIFYTIESLVEWLKGSESLPPESIETEALLALHMRIGDSIAAGNTDRPIPYRLPSEMPLCGTLPKVSTAPAPTNPPADFGAVHVPRSSNVPTFPEYSDEEEGGLDA